MQAIELYEQQRYCVTEVETEERAYYQQLLVKTYASLGFLKERVFPKSTSRCFVLRFNGELCGTFALTPLVHGQHQYTSLIPELKNSQAELLELTNVIIQPELRGGVALGVLLYEAAKQTHAGGYSCLVGITRSQTLRHFVEFGVMPVLHPPLHVMGKPEVMDFAIYYPTDDPDSVFYMHERAKRFFYQERVMAEIRNRYLRRRKQLMEDQVCQQA